MQTQHIEWLDFFEKIGYSSKKDLKTLQKILEDTSKDIRFYFYEKIKIKEMLHQQFKSSEGVIISDFDEEIKKIKSKIAQFD